MISKVARAIAKADNNSDIWSDYMHEAKAAIEAHEQALEEQGLVIVPREPGAKMIDAGVGRLVGWDYNFDSEEHAVENIWQAMLAALEGNDAD